MQYDWSSLHTGVIDSKAVATLEKKLYVAFIDFRKAFDSVICSKWLAVLKKKSLKGKMYQAIVSMYHVVKSKVRAGNDLTESFMGPRGLKQGEYVAQSCFPFL